MLKVLLIILIVLLALMIGVGGTYYFMGSGEPKLISETSEIAPDCSDSDGNDIYKKGYTGWDMDEEGRGKTSEDFCDYHHAKTTPRNGIIRENYCEDGVLRTVWMTCGRGFVCRNGACIEGSEDIGICSETDGGKDISNRGSIFGYGGSGRDDCYVKDTSSGEEALTNECEGDGCYVWEYFCDGDNKNYELIPCPGECFNGACS